MLHTFAEKILKSSHFWLHENRDVTMGHSCKVWCYLEHVCFGFWAFFSTWLGLICLVSGSSPLGLMMGDVTPCLIAHFGRVVLVIQACALQNM
jgi:hypothetical protein